MGGFNQALIFYHFGSVQNALLAALDLISERRLADYGPAFETARTASELGRLARAIYDEDLERGYITALGEMVSGGVSDPLLGAEVAARIEPWIEMVERKLEQLLAGSPLRALVSPRIWRSGSSRSISVSTCSATCSATARAPSRCSTSRPALAELVETFLPPIQEDSP